MATLLPFPKFKAVDSNGNPLAGGQLFTYAAGTTTLQATYTDTSAASANTNPVILDSNGEADVFVTSSLSYKYVLKDALGVTQWTQDNIQSNVPVGPIASSVVSDVATLRLGTVVNDSAILLMGHTTLGIGGGHFRGVTGAAPATYVDNNGTIIVPTGGDGSTAWLREDVGYVTPQMFGASTALADNAPQFRDMFNYAGTLQSSDIRIPPGTWNLGSITGTAPFGAFASLYPNMSVSGVKGATVLKATAGLSTSNQWNFFVLNSATSFEHVIVKDIIFDYNGVNNLVPPTVYRPCIAVWVIVSGTATGRFVEVSGCKFLDNPGSNSVSIVDNNPTGGLNNMLDIVIKNNEFLNFGFLVGDSLNVNNSDHSCVYTQSKRCKIYGNTFRQDFTLAEGLSIGMSGIDLHASETSVHDNICDNVHTFVSHQNNSYNALNTVVKDNICKKVDRIYAAFDGGSGNLFQNLTISGNSCTFPASSRELPCVDLYLSLTDIYFNVRILENNFNFDSGSFSGKAASCIKIRNADNTVIQDNYISNSFGKAIEVIPDKATYRLNIMDNYIVSYGLDEVTGFKKAITVTVPGTFGNTLTCIITGNTLSNGSLATRESAIEVSGVIASLKVIHNMITGATKQVPFITGTNVLNQLIVRNILSGTYFLNFSAVAAVPGQVALNATVTGAAVGDHVEIDFPGIVLSDMILSADVTLTDTVTVRWSQLKGAAKDPDGSGGYYRIVVEQRGFD